MFHFTPLLGAHSASGASQSILEFEGGIRILVDAGWDGAFDVAQLKELERVTPTLSIVLLTHATAQHLGAFAHACKHFPLFRQIPIYATTPVISLGQTLLQDLYASTPAAAGIIPDESLGEAAFISSSQEKPQILYQAPTADEIRGYFGLINDLKYSQPHQPLPSPFSPPLNGLTITAYSAGHTPGGTIWHIQHGMESVVYAYDWNLTRENILSGAAWLGGGPAGGAEVIEQLRKPTALVCSSKGVEKTPLTRQRRDEQLLDMLRHGIERGGTVLVPSDSSARVLEIAYMLDKACASEPADTGLRKAKVFLAGKSMGSAIRYAKSMLEWMNENVVREFENRDLQQKSKDGQQIDKSPFDFRFVKVVEKRRRLEKLLSQSGPRIILASDETLSWGYSREVLQSIAEDGANTVVLTDEYSLRENDDSNQSNLGKTLFKWYQDRQDGVAVEKGSSGQQFEQAFTDGRDLLVREAVLQPLEGNELVMYQNFLATQRQLQTTMQSSGATGLETTADVVDEEGSDASSSTDESEDDQQGKALNFSSVLNQATKAKGGAGAKEALGINALLREPGFYDWDVRGKKGREGMFPFPQKRRRIDDYGEVIRPEDYLRAEERDEMEGQDMRGGEKDQTLGQKRKWDDSIGANGAGKGANQQQGTKKRRTEQGAVTDKGNASDSGYATGDANAESDDSDSEDEYDPADSGPALPSKLIWRQQTIKTNLRIGFVDFAGLHDQRSLTMLVPLINPRKLVLSGGTSSETSWLANECAKKMNLQLPNIEGNDAADILLPDNGEAVIASMDTHAWTVTLSRALTRKLQWQNVRGLGVVTLTGHLGRGGQPEDNPPPDSQASKTTKKLLKQSDSMDLIEDTSGAEKPPDSDVPETGAVTIPNSTTVVPPVLDVVPTNLAAATRTFARPLHVGDLRLADLRKLLGAAGHRAEFRGEGTLVVDGIVAVRKSAGGRIEVEGSEAFQRGYVPQGGSFWEVRKRIYEGLAVIAGG